MDLQKIWPLALILVVLIIAGLLKDTKPKRSLHAEAGIKKLVTETFAHSDAKKLTITMGGQKEPAVKLVRNEKGHWIIPTLFNVPGSENTINSFIDKVKSISGEFRSSKQEILKDFALDEAQAMSIQVCGKDDRVFAHVLIGKTSGSQSFARLPGDSNVYAIAANFRRDLEIRGNDLLTPPESKHFMAKDFVKFDASKINRIDMVLKDKELAFEKKAMPENTSTDEANAAKSEKGKKAPATKWVMVKGPSSLTLKDKMIEETLSALNNLSAQEAVDPTTPAEFGLNTPEYVIKLTGSSKEDSVSIIAHKEDSDGYISADGARSIFKVQSWNFDGSMPSTAKIFEYPAPGLEEVKVKDITVMKGESSFTLTKQKKDNVVTWEMTSPLVVKADQQKVIEAARAIVSLKLNNYATQSARKDSGLDNPQGTVICKMEDGSTVTLSFGSVEKGDQYVELSNMKGIYTTLSAPVKKVLLTLDEIREEEDSEAVEE